MSHILKNPFILVDGSSYLYRAYHAFPSLRNSKEEPTGAIYGVLNMLRTLMLQYQPTNAAVVFDSEGKNFRHELFKDYKSHRLPMPNNLRVQIKPLHEILKAMGLPLLMVSGVEADDVIGTIAHEAEKIGHSVLISTSDKDMAQLVTSGITLMNTITNTLLGPEEVMKKYGVPPALIVDLLALMGDSSDNIPGIPGVSKKIAQALLQGIGGLDKLYKKLDEIEKLGFRGAKNMKTRLVQNKEIAYLSYKLATIKTNIELNIGCEHLLVQPPGLDKLVSLFKKYEFKRWLTDIETGQWLKGKRLYVANKLKKTRLVDNLCSKEIRTTTYPLKNYHILYEESQLQSWIEKLKKTSVFSLNVKTDSIGDIFGNLLGLSFASEPGLAAYLPLSSHKNYLEVPNQIPRNRALELLKPLLENDKVLKVGCNIKFDQSILQNHGIDLRGIAFDITLESYMLNSIAGDHDINSLALRWLKKFPNTFVHDAKKVKKENTFNKIVVEELGHFAMQNVDFILQIHFEIWPKLQQQRGPLDIFKDIEIPLIKVLSRIERNGVQIDPVALLNYSKEISFRLIELETRAHKIAGESFNLSSTKELRTILFERKGIKPFKKTPSGKPSTSGQVLEELSRDHDLAKIIQEHRSLAKLKSTYTDKLPSMINKKTSRIHTSYHQAVTTTGRLSSKDPNLQNIPVRNTRGRRIRQAFIAPKDYLILSADYAQIELRIMAHLSHDQGLLKAFFEGRDIHCVTASEVFGLPVYNVSSEQRRNAKAINFGLIYGMGAFGLSRQLNIPYKESQKYIDLYFQRYPGVRKYMKQMRDTAKEKGYVETLEGRRLYLPEINSINIGRRACAERAAINAPIQGTAADIIKRAMISIDAWVEEEKPRVKMIMQVHDELVFEVYKDDVECIAKKIHLLMEEIVILDIPLLVKMGVGKNWDQAH